MNTFESTLSPSGSASPILVIMTWIAWVIVLLIADFLAFMMLAFADSPDSLRAAKIMIAPLFLWFLFTFGAGIWLIVQRDTWQIPAAFILAISSPVVMFIGYNLFSGGGHRTSTPIPAQPAPVVTINEKFVPPKMKDDGRAEFMKNIEELKKSVAKDREALRKELENQ